MVMFRTKLLLFFLFSTQTWLSHASIMDSIYHLIDSYQRKIIYPIQVVAYHNGASKPIGQVTLQSHDCLSPKDLAVAIRSQLPSLTFSPAKIFNEIGEDIVNCDKLYNQTHIYLVPENRHFVWPTHSLGHIARAPHVKTSNKKVIELQTLSFAPRTFKLTNFFSDEESDFLIQHALDIEEEEFKLRRSSTGQKGYSIDTTRTSENAWDTESKVAKIIKRRCFDLLGMRPFDDRFADGLQILRYNQTTGYNTHLDYITEGSHNENHDYNSAASGTNRFATILLYFNDVEVGGETLFADAHEWYIDPLTMYPSSTSCEALDESTGEKSCNASATLGHQRRPNNIEQETEEYLTAQNVSDLFKKNSWERRMIGECRNRMAVKPRKAEAVLFYNQLPDGRKEPMSHHGSCPVIHGQKWAANLWVWNGPRAGLLPKADDSSSDPQAIVVRFINADVPGAVLYWENTYWDTMKIDVPIGVNTYDHHVWNVKIGDQVIKTFTILPGSMHGYNQEYVLRASELDLPLP